MEQANTNSRGLTIDQFRVRIVQTVGSTGEPRRCMCQHIQRKSHVRTEATINPITDETVAIVLEILPGFEYGGATGIRVTVRCFTSVKCERIFEIAKEEFLNVLDEQVQAAKIDRFHLEAKDESMKKFKLRFVEVRTKDRKATSDEGILEMNNLHALTVEANRIIYDGLSVARKAVYRRHRDFQHYQTSAAFAAIHGIAQRVRYTFTMELEITCRPNDGFSTAYGPPARCSEHDRDRAKVRGRLLKPTIGHFVFYLGAAGKCLCRLFDERVHLTHSEAHHASRHRNIADSPELRPVKLKPVGLVAARPIDLTRDESPEIYPIEGESTLQSDDTRPQNPFTPT